MPPIVGKHTNSFKFSHFSTYAGQVYDGLSQRRTQIKSLLSNEDIENKAQVSQGFLHRRMDEIPPSSINHISDMPDIETEKDIRPRSPFRKWMASMQKRNKHGLSSRQLPTRDLPYWLWGTGEGQSTSPPCYSIRAKTSSGSSFNFVSAVRSASVSLAELSTMTRSKANTAISRCASQIDHGTDVLTAEPKQSEDVSIDRPIKLDPDTLDRAVKRRRILDELVQTEQDYIGDIRLLLNVYVTMLVSLPSLYPGLRQSVNQNLSDILQLHEEFLDELQRAVSHSGVKEFGHVECATGIPEQPLHDRTQAFCRSGGVNVHRGRSIMETSELCAEPQVIVEVSKIFERQMSRFFIYKEYGAKYEMMIQETASVYDTLPDWDWNQKGLEALSALLSTRSCAQRTTNRAATMKDLLVKLFEIIMTACTPKEEVEWRARLSSPLAQCKIGVATTLTFLDLNIKSLGVVTGKSDPGARRLSIRRATTICPKPALYQVIIKNTSGVRQTSGHGSTSLNIHRSHSLLAAKPRVSFLAPPRSERARLEVILADVWSQEILPFSGMSGRSRSERLVRTSASTVIRKLSVASIASSFAKRASGLRQRMSLEDTFRPVGPQTTPLEVADPGSTSNWGNGMSDSEKHKKASTAAAKRSWSQEEIQGTTKKRSGISGHGFRGMFS
ncbi:hypothetical protein J3459_013603 [Metarhizium acridum]|nr:hypothetical protein J3459_013603 [Metarhizium acridum]